MLNTTCLNHQNNNKKIKTKTASEVYNDSKQKNNVILCKNIVSLIISIISKLKHHASNFKQT